MTIDQVSGMTPDQVYFRLCERDRLKRQPGKGRVEQRRPLAMVSPDGLVAGRANDGTPIRARVGGKSVAQRIREQAELKSHRRRKGK